MVSPARVAARKVAEDLTHGWLVKVKQGWLATINAAGELKGKFDKLRDFVRYLNEHVRFQYQGLNTRYPFTTAASEMDAAIAEILKKILTLESKHDKIWMEKLFAEKRWQAFRDDIYEMEGVSVGKLIRVMGDIETFWQKYPEDKVLSETYDKARNALWALDESAEKFIGPATSAFEKLMKLYLQFVEGDERCAHTHLRLQDIWRYFRHTWTNQYASTPGRTMAFLVRDRARPNHPVIGIGALGSPIVQIRERDAWLGWNPEAFLEFVKESPSAELGVWLNKTINTAINELYVADFYAEELLSVRDLHAPSVEIIDRLNDYGRDQREKHHRFANSPEMKCDLRREQNGENTEFWRARTESHLYKSKRALTLADMLNSRMVLQRYLNGSPTVEAVQQLLNTSDGARMVKKVLRKAKADRVGIAMADITGCGAIAPYSPLLGGKLL